jgi:hypothetical protein
MIQPITPLPSPAPTPDPTSEPTSEPTPSPDSAPNGVLADFPIDPQNSHLVRYGVGHTISYDLSYNHLGNPFADPILLNGSMEVQYKASSDPVILEDGMTTITKSMFSDFRNAARGVHFERAEKEEVIQYPDSTTQWLFTEHKRGADYGIEAQDGDDISPVLSVIGQPSLGYEYVTAYSKNRYGSTIDASPASVLVVNESFIINSTEVVHTSLGSFEAYRVDFSYEHTDGSNAVISRQGTYWLHPAIGMIKSKFTMITSAYNETVEYEYQITGTNIAY